MTAGVWAALGSTVVAVIGILGTLVKARLDRDKTHAEVEKTRAEVAEIESRVESTAVEASRVAVGVLSDALEDTRTQVVTLRSEVTTLRSEGAALGARLDSLQGTHRTAVTHIASRESWTANRWPDSRPADLPAIPDELIGEVVAVAPELGPVLVTRTVTTTVTRDNTDRDNGGAAVVDVTPD